MPNQDVPVTLYIQWDGEVRVPIRGYAKPDSIKENEIVKDIGKIIHDFKGEKIFGNFKIKKVIRVIERGVLIRIEAYVEHLYPGQI